VLLLCVGCVWQPPINEHDDDATELRAVSIHSNGTKSKINNSTCIWKNTSCHWQSWKHSRPNWMIRTRQRCGSMSNNFDHLLCLFHLWSLILVINLHEMQAVKLSTSGSVRITRYIWLNTSVKIWLFCNLPTNYCSLWRPTRDIVGSISSSWEALDSFWSAR